MYTWLIWLTWWIIRCFVINPVNFSCARWGQAQNVGLITQLRCLTVVFLCLLPQQQYHCMTDTPVNWPSLIYPGLSWPMLAPGWAMLRHMMHELPACLLFAWVRIDTRLQITSTPAAAWALTTLCSVMHCNFQTSAWRGGVGKGIPTFLLCLNIFWPFLLLSPVPFSFLLLLIPVCLLLLSPHGHACLCFYITSTLLQFNLLHKPGQQGQIIPVSVYSHLSVNQAVDL